MARNFYTPITSSDINRFSKKIKVGISRKVVVILSLKISSQLIRVATLFREMSDIALKPATTRTMQLRDQRWSSLTCGPQTSRTWISSIMLFGGLQQIVYQRRQLQVMTINQMKNWVGQTAAVFGWSRHWSVASPAWVYRPAARRTHWTIDVKTARCDSYFGQ